MPTLASYSPFLRADCLRPSPSQIPSFGFLTKQPFQAIDGATNTSDYISFSRTPANFDFNTTLLLQADTESTYIPVHMSAIDAKVFYIDEDKQVGTGHWEGTMPAKQLYDFQMPIRFHYDAINSSDATCASACPRVDPACCARRPR